MLLRIILFILLLPTFCLAVPSISGVSGIFTNGNTITISGSGLGSKSTAAPILSSFDNAISANNWSTGSIGGDWTTGGTVSLINSGLRTTLPQSSYKISYNSAGDYDSIRLSHVVAEDKLYISWWMYRDYASWNTSGNQKFLRVYQSTNTSDGNWMMSVVFSGSGFESVSTSAEYAPSAPSISIDYSGCSAFLYSAGTWDVRESVCPPTLQGWDHWEAYVDYPSTLGGTDGSAYFFLNGKSHSRVSNIAINNAGDSANDRRWILIGQVSGASVTGNEYIDQIYIDNTVSHVFISDSASVTWPDFGNTHHSEIQVPSAWSDTGITITLNRGTFGASDVAYLYIVDSTGAISNAKEITFGQGISNVTLTSGSLSGGKIQ